MTVTRWPSSSPECRSNRFAKRTPRQVIDRFLSILRPDETCSKADETGRAAENNLPHVELRGEGLLKLAKGIVRLAVARGGLESSLTGVRVGQFVLPPTRPQGCMPSGIRSGCHVSFRGAFHPDSYQSARTRSTTILTKVHKEADASARSSRIRVRTIDSITYSSCAMSSAVLLIKPCPLR